MDDEQPEGQGTPGDQALQIAFNPMYSAYDGGRHTFQVPVRVRGAQGALRVRSSPAGFVDYRPSEEGVTLTTRRAGKATITIRDGVGNTGSATLTVTENDPDDIEIGRERYNNEQLGEPVPNRDLALRGEAACTLCHMPGVHVLSAPLNVNVAGEYTPQQTGGLSDQELGRTFSEGVKPEGWPFVIVSGEGLLSDATAARVFAGFHKWAFAPETLRGVIAYLRSLPPSARMVLDSGELPKP